MAEVDSDKELDAQLEAIRAITNALRPLSPQARQRALTYVLEHMGISITSTEGNRREPETPISHGDKPEVSTSTNGRRPDIRSFAKEKKPSTANEMAAVVAFFLSELAPDTEKVTDLTNADVIKLYKTANFIKLPQDPKQLLKNASRSGYFDSVAHGKYRLNAVGYNLVAHNLPKPDDSARSK